MNGNIHLLGRFLVLSFALLLLLCSVVNASEISQEEIESYSEGVTDDGTETDVVEDPDDPDASEGDSTNVYTSENPLYISIMDETGTEGDTASDPDSLSATGDDYGVSLMADAPIEASDTSGLKAVLLEILGPYEPILFEYSYGNTGTGREVFQDDVWLCSFWMLMLLTYCVFRLIGGWLTRKQ